MTLNNNLNVSCIHCVTQRQKRHSSETDVVSALFFSFVVKVSVPHLATVSEGNLGATYKAVQFHLHWGDNGGPGSEHTIDGEQYPMEV